MKAELTVTALENEDPELTRARALTRPEVTNARTLQAIEDNLELQSLVDTLTEQTQAAAAGNLTRAEEMLAAQAHTLDALFNHLTRRALNGEYLEQMDVYLKMALRAQSQCRATWETLSTVQNPPMVGYVKQANIAHGHQQVNNARKNSKPRNELLEQKDGQRLDPGPAGTASEADPAMATLAEIDRA